MNSRRDSSAASRPLITISVVSHGHGIPLTSLLGSLARHESGSRLELIVTDNLGRDLSALDPTPWHSLTVLRNDRPVGYARNHNTAFEHAQGDYFCVLNPDVQLVQPVFRSLLASIQAGEGAIAGPLVIDSNGIVQDSFRSLPSPLELIQRRLRRWTPAPSLEPDIKVVRTDWLAGIFLLMERETFARLSGFDARYRLYFEDVDFCTRARLMGLASIVNTRARVEHDARRESRRQVKYLAWHLQSSWRFFTSPVYWRARGAGARRGATR